jgi:hypothetical protein
VSVVGFALRLDLGGDRVVGSLTVSISGSEVSSLARREMFVPSLVSFSSSSLSLSSALTYVPVSPGTYRLNISTLGLFEGQTKKGPKLTGDNVSEMCTLPKSCVGGVGALGFLFLAEMNEKETDLHQRMTEAVSLHREVAWSEIKACKSAGIARKTLVK